MAKVIFGAWDNVVIDNRSKKVFEIEECPEFSDPWMYTRRNLYPVAWQPQGFLNIFYQIQF